MRIFCEWRLSCQGNGAGGGVEKNDVGVGCDVLVKLNMFMAPALASVERAANASAAEEDVLDEAGDGGLVGNGVVDEVLLGPGRDDNQGRRGP